jgi:hypothetical protein
MPLLLRKQGHLDETGGTFKITVINIDECW